MKRFSWLHSLKSFLSIANAYHEPDSTIEARVLELGRIAVVCEKLRPGQSGQVEYCGRYWTALCLENVVLLPGARVRVIDRVDLIVVVEPLVNPDASALRLKQQNDEVA